MLFKSVNIVFLLFLVDAFAEEQSSGIPNVDHIFDNLSKQQWDPDEVPCRHKIFDLLENVKNSTFWATWVWNSMEQSPTGIFFGARYHVGSYDQCLRPPWLATHPALRTQYCLAEIEMNKNGVKTVDQITDPYVTAEDYYLNTTSIIGRSFSYIAHGVCLPSGCPHKSVQKLVKALMSTGYLRAAKHAAVSVHHCEEAGAPHQYYKGFYVYISSIAALLFIAVVSTYYVSEYPAIASSNSFANHVAKSFDLRQNWDAMLKESNGDLEFLNGIRFLLANLFPFLHLFLMISVTSVSNALDLELAFTRQLKLLIHGDLLTDYFLAMSALLLGKRISTMDVAKPYNLLKYILLRYVRFIGALAVSVLYVTHVSMHTDDGPVYPKLAGFEQQMCEKNWWLTLLLVGNYYNASEMCFPGTWQVCCDFQLYVVTLTLLYVYRKNASVGKAATAVVLVVGFLCPAITTYVYDLPAVGALNIEMELSMRKNTSMLGYIQTHNRMGAYVVGLVVGYYMSIYKPKDYKKVWSKTQSFVGVCASLSLMLAVLVVGSLCFWYRVYGLVAIVYATFDRIIFAVGFMGLVVFNVYGDVPFIKTFLSWPVFGKLCKVSYGLYLIHILLQGRSKVSLRSHWKFHLFDVFTESQGQIMVSLVLSLVVYLLVEAPLVNITKPYLNTRSAKILEGKTIKKEVQQSKTNEQKIK